MPRFPRLDCATALERFQDCLDEDLSAFQRPVALNIHLADCPACRRRADGLERIHKAARQLVPAPARVRPLVHKLALAAVLFFGLSLPPRFLPAPPASAPLAELERGEAPLLQALHQRSDAFRVWEA